MTETEEQTPQRRGHGPRLEVPRAETTAADGLIIINKPAGVTSHDVVSASRRLSATRKVGHAGTLDPMATGMLIIGVGKATRLLHYITGADKGYLARIQLGVSTDSDDADGEITAVNSIPGTRLFGLTKEIDAQMRYFVGDIMQRPTTVSAIKVNGKRAHALHRAGEEIELAARPVHVAKFARMSEVEFVEVTLDDEPYTFAEFDVVVECSSGTYVRALARDLGAALGLGAHLTHLHRYRVGSWTASQMRELTDISAEVAENGQVQVISLTDACLQEYDGLELNEVQAIALCNGNTTRLTADATKSPIVAALYNGQVRGLLERDGNGYRPLVIFETEMPA
ncbi:tRNA pseudouridine synthase B [Gleimia coleocanis DSM 15436]|uniref:tRNA pseudouridine synthase B n=1 Tax=Gleimia coleocanis DSM 15436 TaxID=525245 RepID=C0W0C7_9ACTO|nr:tRNA pseudouridine(55) synthase TruB [Gleimia coleocanis]EEH63986.1 tRNA pseudouridine synthase B [Gleimia coleocanis DSM 15436]